MRRFLTGVFFVVAVGVLHVAQASVTYDFEGLNVDTTLVGQDGWGPWNGDYGQNQWVQTGGGVNATSVAGNPATGAGLMYRINDGAWSYPAFSGFETDATIEFDVTYSSNGGPHIALGSDLDFSGTLDVGEVGPQFGIANSGFFYIRNAGFGSENQVPVDLAGDPGDWFRMRLVTDFTANGGSGAASLFYENLTRGETSFSPVAGLQNVDVNLFAGADPTTWNAVMSRLDNTGPVSGAAVSQYDNIVTNGSAPYTFEGLNLNAGLRGQDGWLERAPTAPPQDQWVRIGDAPNSSTVAGFPSTSIGLLARKNDGNWSFPAFTGGETNVQLEVDIRVDAGPGGPHVALAHDGDGDNAFAGAEVGPFFGIANGGQFYIRDAGFGVEHQTPITGAASVDDWVRVRLVLDLTANGGDGSASLYYKNLTLGETEFSLVAGLQDVNVALLSGASPSTWDAILTRLDAAAESSTGLYDNITVGLAVPQTMPDLNMDGNVDIFDVAIVSNNWGNSGTPGTVDGDANKDGVVDIFDVALISNNWNPGGAAAVPEPSACVTGLIGLALVASALRRRFVR